jgi:hypothetical protein
MAEVLEFTYESGSREDVYFSSDMSGEGHAEEEKMLLEKSNRKRRKHFMFVSFGISYVILLFFAITGFFIWICVCAEIRIHNNATNYTTNLCI